MKRILPALLAAFLLAGCVTGPKIDWAARVGHYTYEQAVLELGPPDKVARLDSGIIVANWITHQGYAYATTVGAPVYGYYPGGVAMAGYTQGYSPSYYLRLTFGTDGKLTGWKKYAQ
jgi:hypothetical protein